MAETEGLWHFYIQTDFGRYTNTRFCCACQLDDEDAALVIEGDIPSVLMTEHGPWRDTPEEAIIALLEAQLEDADA